MSLLDMPNDISFKLKQRIRDFFPVLVNSNCFTFLSCRFIDNAYTERVPVAIVTAYCKSGDKVAL